MKLDRKLWREQYTSFSRLPCPYCGTGRLKDNSKKSLLIEPAYSKREHGEDWWDPEMILQRFCRVLTCENESVCGETVFVTGSSYVEQGHYEGPDGYETAYYDLFVPKSMYPAPPLIDLPNASSDDLKKEIRISFSLFWNDKTACLNSIRKSVEIILDEARIAKTTVNKKKKRVPLPLHARIDKYESKNKEIAEILMALKWLGNEGSHSRRNAPSLDVVLDAFGILEHALKELFFDNKAKLKAKIRNVNKRKGKT